MRVAAVSVTETADRRCWLARHQVYACTVWGNVTRQSHLAHFLVIVSEHDGSAEEIDKAAQLLISKHELQ